MEADGGKMTIDRIKFLEGNGYEWLSGYLKGVSNKHNLSNVFNPSFNISDKSGVVSFRAISEDKMSSFVLINSFLLNISEAWASRLGCKQLIDPKVFNANGGVYVTFNSGYVKGGNDIYVMKVSPSFEVPKKVVYKDRKDQERNWAFFSVGGDIFALYWANPAIVLKLEKVTDSTWEFFDCNLGPPTENPVDITLGTQLEEIEGKHYFVGHKKLVRNGKKIYLGKLGLFDFNANTVSYEDQWLAHSIDSLYGAEPKTNKNLFSCTYFSGIQNIKNELVLGYGINDVDFGFATKRVNVSGI